MLIGPIDIVPNKYYFPFSPLTFFPQLTNERQGDALQLKLNNPTKMNNKQRLGLINYPICDPITTEHSTNLELGSSGFESCSLI